MKKIIVVLAIIGVGGFLLYDLNKKPSVSYSTKPLLFGFLTINSDTEESTVWVKMQPLKEKIKFSDGPYKVNAEFEGTQWRKIGMAPISKYKLASSNLITTKYSYGLLKGENEKGVAFDCLYDIKIEAQGKEPEFIYNVFLTSDNIAKFDVSFKR